MGVATVAGMIVTVSIFSRRAFCTFAYIATKTRATKMRIIKRKPPRGARDGSAFFPDGFSTCHRRPCEVERKNYSMESAAIASITRSLKRM